MKLPQLSVRDLFWLVLVAAMGCAWWLEHRRTQKRATDAELWESRASSLQKQCELGLGVGSGFDGDRAFLLFPADLDWHGFEFVPNKPTEVEQH